MDEDEHHGDFIRTVTERERDYYNTNIAFLRRPFLNQAHLKIVRSRIKGFIQLCQQRLITDH